MNLETVEQVVALLGEYPVSEIVLEQNGQRICARRPLVPAPPAVPMAPPREEAPTAESPAVAVIADEPLLLTSPMVGLFHHAQPPLTYGSRVTPGQVIGDIEAIKLLTEVVAEFGGVVVEVLTEDGAPVDYGQPLFRLMPSPEAPHD